MFKTELINLLMYEIDIILEYIIQLLFPEKLRIAKMQIFMFYDLFTS